MSRQLEKFGIESTLSNVRSLLRDLKSSIRRDDWSRVERVAVRLQREARDANDEVRRVERQVQGLYEDNRSWGNVLDILRSDLQDWTNSIAYSDTRIVIAAAGTLIDAETGEDEDWLPGGYSYEGEKENADDTVDHMLQNIERAIDAWQEAKREERSIDDE